MPLMPSKTGCMWYYVVFPMQSFVSGQYDDVYQKQDIHFDEIMAKKLRVTYGKKRQKKNSEMPNNQHF